MAELSLTARYYGDLLTLAEDYSAEPQVHKVISSFKFEPGTSFESNCKAIEKYDRPLLDATATFLKVVLLHPENQTKLYSNKEKVSRRIVLAIKSHLPANCPDCESDYIVELNDADKSPLSCFLCFQHAHNCSATQSKTPETTLSNLKSFCQVWLCSACMSNPIESISNSVQPNIVQPNSSQPDSKPPSTQAGSPIESPKHHAKPLTQQPVQLPLFDTTVPICPRLLKGVCPHGISGRTRSSSSATCEAYHPKRCRKYCANGPDPKYGCKKAASCQYYHPSLCKSSVRERKCFNKDCPSTHLKRTQRRELQDSQPQPRNRRNPSSRSNLCSEPKNRDRPQSTPSYAQKARRDTSSDHPPAKPDPEISSVYFLLEAVKGIQIQMEELHRRLPPLQPNRAHFAASHNMSSSQINPSQLTQQFQLEPAQFPALTPSQQPLHAPTLLQPPRQSMGHPFSMNTQHSSY